MTDENQKETLEFLSAHRLPYVCADEPQGYPNSIPPVLAADADETHVVFNNCYRDYAHVNAGQLAGLISPSPPEI
jgi:hypothetical protein